MGIASLQKGFAYIMLLMVVVVFGFASLNSLNADYNQAAPEFVNEDDEHSQVSIDIDRSDQEIQLDLFKGSDYISFDMTDTSLDVSGCAESASNVLEGFKQFLNDFEFVSIHDDANLRRGLSNGPQVYMQCLDDIEEFSNVLIHELGHTVDLLYLDGTEADGKSDFYDFDDPVWKNDPSVKYYTISWINESEMNPEVGRKDFVSGYAMTDPFEDFAETFAMYVKYGEIFRFLIAKEDNEVLRSKYFFMKYVVFEGEEFGLDKEISFDAVQLFWSGSSDLFDVTKLHNLV